MKKMMLLALALVSTVTISGCVGDETQTIGESDESGESVNKGKNPDADVQLTVNLWAQLMKKKFTKRSLMNSWKQIRM
ncbi:hypothetical protein [Bacillus sp. JCM 19041]|uniref:hypothetical protein n=1 Tax=Bacillus sp. JCM 19041 TaxID=1460637 RepID=UPI0006D18D15